MEGTEALRCAAPHWSLDGDRRLLDALQGLHQRIVCACEETDRKLGALVAALDDAGLHLRNVNNKFMALSNSQFIESRVYEDDADIADSAAPVKDPPTPASVESELSNLRRGLETLERLHENVTILPSDSESDSEDEDSARVVLKPRDVYAHRPLPHIIGSHGWRSKWHAGLMLEDSDSDSSLSGVAHAQDIEQYSDEEPEMDRPQPDTVSTSSSELGPGRAETQQSKTPSAVAAELARRLGAQTREVPVPQQEYSPPEPTVRKVYKPHQPAPGTIFPDEPPPLEPSDQSDDDIFAELHKNRPYADSDKARVPVDLFGHNTHYESEEDGDIFNDIPEVVKKPIVQTNPSAKPKSTLFEDEPEPELFAEKPVQDVKPTDTESKKPIGGISLFGTNKTSESIGAAILKRNQRRSSTSGEESATDDIDSKLPAAPHITKKPEVKKGNEMFDELFAKSKKMQQKNVKKEEEVKKEVKTEKKVDLFSDNLFDDIDDIFSTNIVAKVPLKEPVKGEKSIFDDEDDLFADIPTTKPTEAKTKNAQDVKAKNDNVKSIFDSDDDLFSENTEKVKVTEKAKGIISEASNVNASVKISQVNKVSEKRVKESKSLFDSDDDIFSEVKTKIAQEKPSIVSKPKITKDDLEVRVPENNISQNVQETKTKNHIFADDDDDLFLNKESKEIKRTSSKAEQTNNDFINKKNIPKPINKSPNLFDDEDEDSDNLFSSSKKPIENVTTVKSKDIIEETKTSEVETSQTKTTNKNDIFVGPGSPAKVSSKEGSFTKLYYIENEDAVEKDKPILSKTQENNKEKVDDFSSKVYEEKSVIHRQDNIVKEKMRSEESQGSGSEDGFKDNLLTKSHENKQAHSEKPQTHKPVIAQKPSVDHKIQIKEETSKPKEVFIQPTVPPEEDPPELENKEIAIDPRVEVKGNVIPDPDNIKEKDIIENINEQTDLNTPDIFTDVFNDQPPEFEKPKEPKRSKNVNALFDDDSDDEALFFRKTDPTLDEKPEDFSPKVPEDRLFGIFHDEPPAIDVDFEQKAEKVDIFNDEVDDFLDTVDTAKKIKSKEDKTANAPLPELPKAKKEITNVEPKKIGKLKPMNFNINVNTLLPGSSPKKAQKSNEQIDGQASSKSNEELHTTSPTTEETKPKLVKSISFEGDPESNVLDNKLSKERPKIQVKRRPSTRRARREAVKKSGIDFGEDSTDNSSSIDDAPRVKNEENSSVKICEKSINSDFDQEIIRDDYVKEPVAVTISADSVDDSKLEEKYQESPVSSTKIVYILNDEDIFSDMKPTPKVEENKPSVTKNKILNIVDDDDDIFKSIAAAKPENVEPETAKEVQNVESTVNIGTLGKVFTESAKTENIFDNDDDIFRGFSKTESKTDTAITEKATKPEPVQESKPSKSKSSIFDDLSDEENELFNTKKADTSKTIFHSDSEEELFSGKSKREAKKVEREEVAVKREIKHVEVKGSLFGDDDDDDLFGIKAKVTEPVPQTKSAPREASSKPAEPVFEDPLSLLGGEDD